MKKMKPCMKGRWKEEEMMTKKKREREHTRGQEAYEKGRKK